MYFEETESNIDMYIFDKINVLYFPVIIIINTFICNSTELDPYIQYIQASSLLHPWLVPSSGVAGIAD